MDVDEIESSAVMALVREELAKLDRHSHQAVLEVEAAIDQALRQRDYGAENDGDKGAEDYREEAGAIALATLLEFASCFDLESYQDLLSGLNGALSQQIQDVQYVVTSLAGSEVFRPSEYLPSKLKRLQPKDKQAAEAFVVSVIRPSAPDPDPNPGTGPKYRGGPF